MQKDISGEMLKIAEKRKREIYPSALERAIAAAPGLEVKVLRKFFRKPPGFAVFSLETEECCRDAAFFLSPFA